MVTADATLAHHDHSRPTPGALDMTNDDGFITETLFAVRSQTSHCEVTC